MLALARRNYDSTIRQHPKQVRHDTIHGLFYTEAVRAFIVKAAIVPGLME